MKRKAQTAKAGHVPLSAEDLAAEAGITIEEAENAKRVAALCEGDFKEYGKRYLKDGRAKANEWLAHLQTQKKKQKGTQKTAGKSGDSSGIAEVGHVRLPVEDIHPSPENDKLYRPIDPAASEIKLLAESIRRDGLLQPLDLTSDHFIWSGHRRFAAGKLAGFTHFPCRIRADVSRADHPDEHLHLLREANRQRVKSLDEQIREEVISADPEEAYQVLIDHRKQRALVSADTIDLGGVKRRKEISDAKMPMLAAVIDALNKLRKFWPISERRIHYELLSDPPLRHASKPDSRYANTKQCSKDLSDLVTRARLDGQIPMHCIADETRPTIVWEAHRDVSDYVRNEIDGFLKGYARELLQSQPNHIELILEKNTLLSILRPVAMEYTMPLTSGRGYASVPPRAAIAERFRKSGKEKLILLMVGDFDPDGESIAKSFARTVRDDLKIDTVEAIKVALNAEQVKAYELPPLMTAKAGCSTRDEFVETNGEFVWEVEALEPTELQRIVRKAIDSVLDIDAFNAELDREKEDAKKLEDIRRRAHLAIGEATR